MSVVSQVILLVSAACEVVQENAAVGALDIAAVQVMDEGVTVLVDDLQDAAVPLLVDAASVGLLHTVGVKSCLLPMEMVSGIVAEAGAELHPPVFALLWQHWD
ncbi:hypothetical protein SLEP1_g15419 [Rubroshorea leprosula]|uniref:Secreted protein n=1 Tax=Rubroshorea leprosula TaxID=152421 RepID=A0AAV5IMA5_9ROSI|nr:hypothetical protein SLEP1_g15419 [Rubroshorea leprosula]